VIDCYTRRTFLGRGAAVAAGLVALPALDTGFGPTVANAHNVSGNAARARELYAAMQKNFYLSDSKLYLETSPRARSNPYAYVWPFYEALAGTIDLLGIGAVGKSDVDDRLVGLAKYYRGTGSGYDSYPRSSFGAGGDRYYDDNAWVARAFIQLHRMGVQSSPSALGSAQDTFRFLETGWADDRPGGVYWVKDGGWNFDRGTGPTGGFAKVALHLSELEADGVQKATHLDWGVRAYDWVTANLLTKPGQGQYAGRLYWDKILGDNTIDTRYWSYNQGVMIGAGVLLYRLTADDPNDPTKKRKYLDQAVTTADAAIAYYDSVGWYTQPVIFNSLFFRNLLLLCGEIAKLAPADPARARYATYLGAAQSFANRVWDDPKVHNQQKHLIKFEERTSAFKLREQAAMVQLFACLAWTDAKNDLSLLA